MYTPFGPVPKEENSRRRKLRKWSRRNLANHSATVRQWHALQEEYVPKSRVLPLPDPIVSVVIPVYQHVAYLNECLASVVTQALDVPWEVVIGDDGSTDGSTEICIKFAEDYPDLIRLFIRDRSTTQFPVGIPPVGNSILNGLFCLWSARGQFIALCEGDDYWTDARKLSKQYTVLRDEPEIAQIAHNIVVEQQSMLTQFTFNAPEARRLNQAMLLDFGWLPTCSIMFRNEIDYDSDFFRMWFRSLSHDLTIQERLSTFGDAVFLPEAMSVYRRHSEGLTSSAVYKDWGAEFGHLIVRVHTLNRPDRTRSWRLEYSYMMRFFALCKVLVIRGQFLRILELVSLSPLVIARGSFWRARRLICPSIE